MSKLINISNKTYEKLKAMKEEGESFSIVIEKLVERKEKKRNFLEFYGAGGIDEKAIKEIKKGWKRWSKKSA
ncbi:MAG: antitoxin [Nanoarchaeota archaeon]|nr:antitoxin [Nanoarchaeota archaeon]